MEIKIDPTQYDQDEMEDIVTIFFLLIDELVDEEGVDRTQAITGMAIALRMIVEQNTPQETVH